MADYYHQSTTACCPRETIPDSCSCPEGCMCNCLDCDCAWCDDEQDGDRPRLTTADLIASLPQRARAVAEAINDTMRDVLPEGLRFEWEGLGITDDEVAAEAASFEASRAEFLSKVAGWPYLLRHPDPPRFERLALPAACYRSEYGFTVHIKGACRC